MKRDGLCKQGPKDATGKKLAAAITARGGTLPDGQGRFLNDLCQEPPAQHEIFVWMVDNGWDCISSGGGTLKFTSRKDCPDGVCRYLHMTRENEWQAIMAYLSEDGRLQVWRNMPMAIHDMADLRMLATTGPISIPINDDMKLAS